MPGVSSIVTSSVLSTDKYKTVPRRKFLPKDIGDLIREVTGRKTAEKTDQFRVHGLFSSSELAVIDASRQANLQDSYLDGDDDDCCLSRNGYVHGNG